MSEQAVIEVEPGLNHSLQVVELHSQLALLANEVGVHNVNYLDGTDYLQQTIINLTDKTVPDLDGFESLMSPS